MHNYKRVLYGIIKDKKRNRFLTNFSAAVSSMNLDPCPGLPVQVTLSPDNNGVCSTPVLIQVHVYIIVDHKLTPRCSFSIVQCKGISGISKAYETKLFQLLVCTLTRVSQQWIGHQTGYHHTGITRGWNTHATNLRVILINVHGSRSAKLKGLHMQQIPCTLQAKNLRQIP